ncbi:phage tail tube protein [Streptococcus marmotae]|uniref:phage tail tube protein n=1 Tax=Streptococcus marmotae TaxID=1825069 RepID=UPI0008359887|nr:phage tail protein [Streptococcus marmotae]QBX16926.1 major tail shaft protein [Streptococcus phage Javan291]
MPKNKNALRKHYVAPWDSANPDKMPTDWLWLAAGIKSAEPDNDENTEDEAFYDGDGTEETTIVSVKRGYKFEGYYIPEDKAQAHIAGLDLKDGDERRVWFKVVSADKKKQRVGVATVKDIEITGGEAQEYEKFACSIGWNTKPVESAVVE